MDEHLGQVYTPRAVADLTLALTLEGLPPSARVLDPACGDGVFLARARALGWTGVEGIEIDADAAAAARAHGEVAVADFLDTPPPARPYDALVGNPPYVRQERLGARKQRIQRRLELDYPELAAKPGWLSRRSDLALAFVARALRFVRPGGRVGLVVSAALLDAEYGAALAELCAGRARLQAVVASPRERWFADAAVNAVILILQNESTPAPVRIARLTVPVAQARASGMGDLHRFAEVREAPPGAALPPLLRAPDEWFAAAASPALVPLGELAEVTRGVTSGANDFFYLARDEAGRRGIEPRFLAPLLRSPRHVERIGLDARRLPTLAFVCGLGPAELAAHPGARRHVEGHLELAARPTLASRPRWWSLPARPARLFLTKAYAARFVQPLVSRPVIGDQRLYAVAPRHGVALPLLAAALNGTLAALALESLGRASLGEGALELSVADAARLPIVDVRRLREDAVLAALRPLLERDAGDVFSEAEREDRRRLDAALAAPFPELAALAAGLPAALARTVGDRLHRAASK